LKRKWSSIYHPLRRLLRFEAYGILFVLAGIFGSLLAGIPPVEPFVLMLVFTAASSAFGFVINDISDIALDARSENPRNPLADGSLSCRAAWLVSASLLAVTAACMALLPWHLLPVELLVLFVFVTYSFGFETKNIAGLDLLYHALFPALYGLLGYAIVQPVDITGWVFVLLLGIFGAIGELGNEIRDFEKDRHTRRNSAMLIGERPACILTMALMVFAFALIACYGILQPGYTWLLPFVPAGVVLLHPVYRAMDDHTYRKVFVDAINTRSILIAAAMLLLYLYIRFFVPV
jgi:4-hydroxybenzoate polyprenyltransferase